MTQSSACWQQPLQFLVIGGILALSPLSVAQLAPIADDTLGNERSIVSPDQVIRNLPSNQIDGGARRGSNLFHSFRDFNVDNGRGVYFSNPTGVANILTRITGGNPSQILGILGVEGTANLFLINPNGILFGPNARLDLRGGSFLASTANSIAFNNGFAFSATDPQAPPLLAVNVPVGLQYGNNPGEIRSQGAILQVPDRQTLTLAGGDVNISGIQGEAYPRLYARGGRVELAGVAGAGEVGLTQQGQEWRLSLPEGLARADVSITNNATVSVRLGGGGNIAVNARTLNILGNGSKLMAGMLRGLGFVGARAGDIDINATQVTVAVGGNIAGGIYNVTNESSVGDSGNVNITTDSLRVSGSGARVETNVFGTGNGGSVVINARDSVTFEGNNVAAISTLGRTSTIGEAGNGGNVIITTGSLRVLGGADINASTYGKGNGGNIIISARDSVIFDGGEGTGGAAALVEESGNGNGGNINITTGSLTVMRGADINASTYSTGNGGNVIINARDSVTFDGVGSSGSSSRATSRVEKTGNGNGGDINITTRLLSITGGAFFATSTLGQGNAGNINITARDSVSFDGAVGSQGSASGASSTVQLGAIGKGGDIYITTGNLALSNGAGISASTSGRGDAGNITITTRDSVFFDGVDSDGFPGGAFSTVESQAVGRGGRIEVNTNLFSIMNRGVLTASSNGQGDAGNIDVNARQIRLDNQGSIQAQTASGQGGNIRLQVPDLLLLRRNSFISTTAGTAQAGGDGGNITFKGNFIVAVPNENSDISANAFTGRGGRVEISAQSIFGIQPRLQLTPLSDITASSDFGVAGVVDINTPDVDPNRGLVQLPADLTDASRLIVQACPTGSTIARQSNEFIITGRGGLPPTPSEAVNQDAIQVELVTADVEGIPPVSQRQQPASTIAPPIVEAQRLQVMADGTVFLMAALPDPVAPLPDRLVPCP
ncbi:filamentous hemagglutinin N-terminal domain-containing protein [Phormidesmis sp. 146-12]